MAGTSPNNDVLSWGRVQRYLETAQRLLDGGPILQRLGSYGETIVEVLTGKQHKLADEGSYFITRTPTIGTGVASITTPTAFVDTSPYIIVTNGNAPGGKSIYMDFIKLILVTPGTSSTDLQYATRLDVIPRYTSGGAGGSGTNVATLLSGPFPTNLGAVKTNASSALIYAGALVAVAGSSLVRSVDSNFLRTAIAVAKDTYHINFGPVDQGIDGVLVSGAAIAQRSLPHPPVVIPPQGSFLFHLYGTASAAATTCEVVIGHVER